MGKILLGLLLYAIDIGMPIGDGRIIGIMPDFLGYLCIAWGLREMKHASGYFAKGETAVFGVSVVSFIIYVMDLMGFGNVISFTLLGVDILELAGFLAVLFLIMRGIQDVETEAKRDLRTAALKMIWVALAVVSPIAYITSLFNNLIGNIFSVPTIILDICYILAFYRCKVAYEEYMAEQD